MSQPQTLLSRRTLLQRCALGFGSVALRALFSTEALAANGTQRPHFRPRAKSIIFLYMDGGPSQVDTFDPKPMLDKYHGRDPKEFFAVQPTQFNNNGQVLGSPWKFRQAGDSGLAVSDLFPSVRECVDDMAIINSMISEFSEHTFANYFLHTGNGLQGRPSMGAWMNYGLGSPSQNLPGFVVLNGGLIPPGGLDCFGSGFLPASYQGSVFKPKKTAVANITPMESSPAQQRAKLDLVAKLDEWATSRYGQDDKIESAIANYELAFRMQIAVPELMDISSEPKYLQKRYGLESDFEPTRIYARQCLLARRLVERGVRFVELTCPQVRGDRWDQHRNLKDGHTRNALAVDQPIATLLKDLKQRGLLDETLIVWAGEFGRTPFAQGKDGRDHNPFGFSIWLAGGGVKGGITYGATDEWGYKAIENRVEIHDLHATMLHLLGVEHTQSTFRFGGRDMRLTDVKGHVLHKVMA